MAEQTDAPDVVLTTPDDIERTPKGIVQRWVAELNLAAQEEKDWQKEAKDVLDLYDAKKATANSFNILWSNTETLAPAVYNSTPEPDVRRRFRDADQIGKVASTILERALSYQVDDYDFDYEINDVVLDALLPGRGIGRIMYEPQFIAVTPQGVQAATPAGAYQEPPKAEGAQPQPSPTQPPAAPAPEPYEKIVGQSAQCCHVQWDDFRRGPGKRWRDVPWVAFRHEFTQDMAIEKFGEEIAKGLTYEQGKGTEKISEDKTTREIFKVCEVWEIWDKEKKRVLFIAPTHKAGPCFVTDDPLKLRGFFPMPRPIYAIRNSRSLVPRPLFKMYEQQAKELDSVSARINKIVKAIKVRGLYASHIKEAADLLEAADNAMLAIENPSLIAEHGGLDKLIWILPLEKLAATLEYLYKARDQIKQAIYEISGIADILRGATNPNETLGAQQLKSQWGSLRIQKLQREIQRFCRDMYRLKAEVISQEFTAEQLATMTNIQLPDAQAKQRAEMAARAAQMAQQPVPPEAEEVLAQPTWEDILQLLRSDEMRQYRVDIETDSTVADTLNQDMQGLAEVLQQIASILGGVAQGLPMDVAKNIALSVVRRARMGSAVEDALEALQQPPPPEAAQPPPDHSIEVAQIQAENKAQIAQMQEDTKVQIAQIREQAANERQGISDEIRRGQADSKAQLDAAVKLIVAQISATKAVEAATAKNAQREFAEGVS
jgi:hypothetical protein